MAIGDGMLAQVLLDYFHQHAAILRTDFKQPCHQWCRSYKAPHRPTVCPSNDSSSVLSYQWFPTTIRSGETITRRRKEGCVPGSTHSIFNRSVQLIMSTMIRKPRAVMLLSSPPRIP